MKPAGAVPAVVYAHAPGAVPAIVYTRGGPRNQQPQGPDLGAPDGCEGRI